MLPGAGRAWKNPGTCLAFRGDIGAAQTGDCSAGYITQTSCDRKSWSSVNAGDVTIIAGTLVSYSLNGQGPRFVRLAVNPD